MVGTRSGMSPASSTHSPSEERSSARAETICRSPWAESGSSPVTSTSHPGSSLTHSQKAAFDQSPPICMYPGDT